MISIPNRSFKVFKVDISYHAVPTARTTCGGGTRLTSLGEGEETARFVGGLWLGAKTPKNTEGVSHPFSREDFLVDLVF